MYYFKKFHYRFYGIGVPVREGYETLGKAGLLKEQQIFLEACLLTGKNFVDIGLNYPKFEVNFEQSIVAPSVVFLLELYQISQNSIFLAEAEHQLPILKAFNGHQPDYHLNQIAMRHWDGFWFGKYQVYGDTFPHYWSTITAIAFWRYFQITGKQQYYQDALEILNGNLCQFFPDGSASCAYLYLLECDGKVGHFFDPYANDQDWALVHYLMVKRES